MPPGPPLVCRVCRTENPTAATFCNECRNPVSAAAEEEVLAQTQEALKEKAARILAGLNKEELAARLGTSSSEAGPKCAT